MTQTKDFNIMSDDKNQAADAAGTKPEGDSQQQNSSPKSYSEEMFKEVVSQRDSFKAKLREIESRLSAEAEARQADELKKKGDYEALAATVKLQAEKQEMALKSKALEFELAKLAAKHRLLKPEYLTIFDKTLIKLDSNLQVVNPDEVERAFEKFKLDNPTLFAGEDKKPVPKTDNLPFRKPTQESSDSKKPATPLSQILMDRKVKQ